MLDRDRRVRFTRGVPDEGTDRTPLALRTVLALYALPLGLLALLSWRGLFGEGQATLPWGRTALPVAAAILAPSALVAWLLERRRARREPRPAPSLGRAVLRYELLPALLGQAVILAAARAVMRLPSEGMTRAEVSASFRMAWVALTLVYVGAVALPLLLPAWLAHRREVDRRDGRGYQGARPRERGRKQ